MFNLGSHGLGITRMIFIQQLIQPASLLFAPRLERPNDYYMAKMSEPVDGTCLVHFGLKLLWFV